MQALTLLTTLLATTALAAPTLERRHTADAFTTAGMNCWGRNQPGDAGQGQWSIRLQNVDPKLFSSAKFTKQLTAKDVGPIRYHFNLAPNGDLAINFSASLSATAHHVAQAFANSDGKTDPACHWYGGSATEDVNQAMDATAHAAG